MGHIIMASNLTEELIRGMFLDYVTSKEDAERHSEESCKAVDAFDENNRELFPDDVRIQNELYDQMMEVAVCYEEDGFVAGAKWVLDLIRRGLLIPPAKEKSK